MATNPIAKMLDEAKEDLVRAQENLDEQRAHYQAAETRLAAAQAKCEAFEQAFEAANKPVKTRRKRSSRASTGASDDNKKLFTALYHGLNGNEFGYDDIEVYAGLANVDINMTNMRSNASDYVKQGYLERPVNGRFIITDMGKKFFGISDEPKTMPTPRERPRPETRLPGMGMPPAAPPRREDRWGADVDDL